MSESVPPSPAAERLSEIRSDTAVLSGDLSIRDAGNIRDRLAQLVSDGGPVRIDLGSLTSLDASVVQLLIAAKRSADRRGRAFEIHGVEKSPLPDFMTAVGLASDELYDESRTTERQDARVREAEPVIAPENAESGDLFWLSDDQMDQIRPFFPTKSRKPRAGDRRVLSGIIHVRHNRLRWR